MRLVIRADASRDIGTGHVVRCASLARLLRARGAEVVFCCRPADGDMIGWLRSQDFAISEIGADDAAQTHRALRGADWLMVDHYGLDAAWERAARGDRPLFALDDLGRGHDCQLLLDQNYDNPLHQLYPGAVPPDCELLLGPRYALIRPEFAALREISLARPHETVSRLLVFMSGIDEMNETAKALEGIALSRLCGAAVDAVIGAANPHRARVEAACGALPQAKLHVQTTRMAELMAQADLMLCAGGSATWERCTLGVPALLTILADNQVPIAKSLQKAGAHVTLGWYDRLVPLDYAAALDALSPQMVTAMSHAAAGICDGKGLERVATRLKEWKTGLS